MVGEEENGGSPAETLVASIEHALTRIYSQTRGTVFAELEPGPVDPSLRGHRVLLASSPDLSATARALPLPPHWTVSIAHAWPMAATPATDLRLVLGRAGSLRLTHASGAAIGPDAVEAALREALVPADMTSRDAGVDWRRFCAERIPSRTIRFLAFDVLQQVLCGRIPRRSIPHPNPTIPAEWEAFVQAAPRDGALTEAIAATLLPRALAADALAVRYAAAYRSDGVVTIALSTLAVLGGLAAIATGVAGAATGWQALFLLTEAMLVLLAVASIRRGRRARWHERWLAYRYIAERLRHGRILAWLPRASDAPDPPSDSAQGTWPDWYVGATMRELPLPADQLDETSLRALLTAAATVEIDGQIAYARTTEATLSRLDRTLRALSLGAFVLALVAIAVGLVMLAAWMAVEAGITPVGTGDALAAVAAWVGPALVVLSPGLPAVAAGFSALRARGDYALAAADARATGHALQPVRRRIDTLLASPSIDPVDAVAVLRLATSILSADVTMWHRHYTQRPLDLT